MSERWNHNLHYHSLVLRAAPASCRRALDVGCGEGVLARELRAVSREVVGIDRHGPSIEQARRQGGAGVAYFQGDLFTHPFEPASFDLVASVAALHHMDTSEGLARMAALVRPGGVLVVVGLARSRTPRDLAFDLAGAVATRVHQHLLGKRYWEHDAPKQWPPPDSYGQLRRTAERVLPGVRYRRHALWRYSLSWRRPG